MEVSTQRGLLTSSVEVPPSLLSSKILEYQDDQVIAECEENNSEWETEA